MRRHTRVSRDGRDDSDTVLRAQNAPERQTQ